MVTPSGSRFSFSTRPIKGIWKNCTAIWLNKEAFSCGRQVSLSCAVMDYLIKSLCLRWKSAYCSMNTPAVSTLSQNWKYNSESAGRGLCSWQKIVKVFELGLCSIKWSALRAHSTCKRTLQQLSGLLVGGMSQSLSQIESDLSLY